MQYDLSDFERKTLAYLLWLVREGGKTGQERGDDDVIITVDAAISVEEYRALCCVGNRIIRRDQR